MSKIRYLRVIMEHHGLEYTINGKDTSIGGYNGLCITEVNKLDIMVNASTLESCIIQMETAIDAYLTKEYYSLPVIEVKGEVPLAFKSHKTIGPDPWKPGTTKFIVPIFNPNPIIKPL